MSGGIAADDCTHDRRGQHPGDEAPVDAVGTNVGDRPGGSCQARYGDIRAPDRRRIRAGEQQNRQPDVAQDETQQAPGERHDEAPDADGCEGECVHALEYVP